MVNIGILGCCCTGDIFRLSPDGFKVVQYFAGTSLISIMAKPLDIDETAVTLQNRFEKKSVLHDFRKDFFAAMAAAAPDYLVMDFVQDASGNARVGDSYLTWSQVMRNAFAAGGLPYQPVPLEHCTPEMGRAWREAAGEFVPRLQEVFAGEQIILHRAYWREYYRCNGRRCPFPPERIAEARKRNAWLTECYDYFLSLWPEIRVLDINGAGYIADPKHTWGLTPHHFETGYYQRAAEEIRRIAAASREQTEAAN